MTQITAKQVNELRKQTGAGMMDCKKALVETSGDFDKAIDVLRKKGQKVAAKRADREAAEGVVLAMSSSDKNSGAIICLNCETDFVAKNESFVDLAKSILSLALNSNCNNLDEIKQLVAPINDKDTFTCVSAERRVALELDANCDLPIGIFASVSGDNFSLRVFMSDGDGEKIIKESISGSYKNISEITKQLLATLRKRGSKEILIRRSD